ncbi:MAG TPA: cobyrinic acid a,c-diamide synthase, partial [Geobacteraceae bacterium]|nr:cobyrinic acid a,c-diamide synthase [Geobacteraceae bacterium]
PELYAESLAANRSMMEEIRKAVDDGMPVYAECGGFIYMTDGMRGSPPAPGNAGSGEQDLIRFVGIFPVTARMLPRRKALGYRQVKFLADSPIARKEIVARGHEFHYSEMEEMPGSVERAYRVQRNGADLGTEGYRYKNCLASYIHLHFGSCPELAGTFVENCREFNDKNKKNTE